MSDKKSIINITGLWVRESKNGNEYMQSAKVTEEMVEKLKDALNEFGLGAKFMIFQTKEKKSKNSPDYSLCVAAPSDDEE